MLEEEMVLSRYQQMMEFVKQDSRYDKLKKLYEDYEQEMLEAPASSKVHHHNAFPGGYVDHVVRVVETSIKMAKLYKETGGTINFTKEELIFAALHHDLGKLGNVGTPYYIEQDSDWHRKRGELYKHNPSIEYMKVTDRALFILQKYGVQITQNEWLAIKLSDGLYDRSNEAYLINYNPKPIHTSLPIIIHLADHMASQCENDSATF